jgi:hypothetical protein
VAFIMSWHEDEDGEGAGAALGTGRLAGFRRELYLSLGTRRDVLFEACDAALCKAGRVLMLAERAWSRSAAAGTARSTTR